MSIAVRDGLKGLSEVIDTTWEHTVMPQCIVHLIRTSVRHTGRQRQDATVTSQRPVHTTTSGQTARDRFEEFVTEWGERSPAVMQWWPTSWAEFIPFPEHDIKILRMIRGSPR